MASSQNHPRAVRRGNTSGLIGLWQSRASNEDSAPAHLAGHSSSPLNSNSPNVSADTLAMRTTASRRISVRDPPKHLSPSSSPRTAARPMRSTGLSPAADRLRKTSEVVRPSFSIYEEKESEGQFVSGILCERPSPQSPGFSFVQAQEEKAKKAPARSRRLDLYGRRDTEEELCLSVPVVGPRAKTQPRTTTTKTTATTTEQEDEDKEEAIARAILEALESKPCNPAQRCQLIEDVLCERRKAEVTQIVRQVQQEAAAGSRRGSAAGLGRSKSVKYHRAKPRDDADEESKVSSSCMTSSGSGSRDAADNDGPRLARQVSMPSRSFLGGASRGGALQRPQECAARAQNGRQLGAKSGGLVRSATSAKETILAWVQETVNHYPNVNVTNFSSSWSDGLAFCALIHKFYPEAFDFNSLEARNRRFNFDLAFKAAEEYGDVCPLLEVDDMVMMKTPDWKCVFTYVQSFYRRFRNGREKVKPTKVLVL